MKSLVTLLTYHLLFQFPAHLHHRFRELANQRDIPQAVFIPALNKGLTYLKIDSQKHAYST